MNSWVFFLCPLLGHYNSRFILVHFLILLEIDMNKRTNSQYAGFGQNLLHTDCHAYMPSVTE